MKYKYVIIGSGSLYYPVGYSDLYTLPNVCYLTEKDQKISALWYRLAYSYNVPKFLRSIISPIVCPYLYPLPFDRDDYVCYIFFGSKTAIYQSSYMKFLESRYKNIKKVLYMQDLVARNPWLDLNVAKKNFDLLLTYDKSEAAKYNMIYHPTPYSIYDVPIECSFEESDVFFCGLAKSHTRYRSILECYDACMKKGLKCLFFVSSVDDSMERRSGIIYNQRLSYEQILRYLKRTKCILEVMQDGAVGYTPRTWESIIYDKHLLTNNEDLSASPFYNDSYMHQMGADLESIDMWINENVNYDISVKESLSPIRLLEKIEAHLAQ